MNFVKINLKRIIFFFLVGLALFFPSPASACSLSGIGNLFPLIQAAFVGAAGLLTIVFLVVLIGLVVVLLVLYILYVFFSIRLARQAATAEGTTKFTRVIATILAVINTLLFLGFSASNGFSDMSYFYFDLPMWGIPFYYYMKGIRSTPPSEESLANG